MREVTHKIYLFEELSDDAKEVARQWYRDTADGEWIISEGLDSIRAFCDSFSVTMTDYSIGAYGHSYIETNAENRHFRGLKLKAVDRDAMPTGYFLDCTLYETFYDEFKSTGNALKAFVEAIDESLKVIVDELESRLEDEAVDEMIVANEYEFTEDGKRY